MLSGSRNTSTERSRLGTTGRRPPRPSARAAGTGPAARASPPAARGATAPPPRATVAFELDGLDRAVLGPGHRARARRGVPHRLVVQRVDLELGLAQRLGQPALGLDLHLVDGLVAPLVLVMVLASDGGDVLDERAAEGDIGDLHAPADGQHGDVAVEGALEQGDVEGVAPRVDVVGLGRRRRPVEGRLDVAPTREHHAVHRSEDGSDVVGIGDGEDHGHAPRPLHRFDVVPGRGVEQRRTGGGVVCLGVGRDADERLHGSRVGVLS